MFTHKELGLIMAFESVENQHNMLCWIKDVERLPAPRAALVMREVLIYKVKSPAAQQQEFEDLEKEYKDKIEDLERQFDVQADNEDRYGPLGQG